MDTNFFGKYFGTDDYVALDAKDRALVDKWLEENDAMNKVSLVQEIDGGSKVLLSGPKVDEEGMLSELELEEIKTLDENTFPWEILKKV
jgi:phosphoribosylformimino-5-aminoimidazole carboxamide ribonucleotide (ProFAR) isomerase